ncbi:MAG: DUF2190 family protein [Burkholderiaceae bacterium]
MKNYVQSGDTITVQVNRAVASGGGFQVGTGLFGIAATPAANTENTELKVSGVFDVACVPANTFAPGAPVYWDNTAFTATSVVATNLKIGTATATKVASTTTVRVRLFTG